MILKLCGWFSHREHFLITFSPRHLDFERPLWKRTPYKNTQTFLYQKQVFHRVPVRSGSCNFVPTPCKKKNNNDNQRKTEMKIIIIIKNKKEARKILSQFFPIIISKEKNFVDANFSGTPPTATNFFYLKFYMTHDTKYFPTA